MEVQRHRADFDGIIAGAPPFHTPGHLTRIWIYQHLLADAAHYIPSSKLQLIGAAVTASCDARHELVDGIIGDPRRCAFDPSVLQCTAGGSAGCLTPTQVDVLKKI
jgi:feruloyl esterase